MVAPLLSLLLGYLFGSFPTGYLAARFLAGVDVRQTGSGRTGGTNVLRSAGRNAAIITVVGDTLKGILAVLIARLIWPNDPQIALIASLAALGVVLGHNYSIFLGFKGGAGTMTGGGALLSLDPVILLASAILPLIFAWMTRMSSIGSMLFTGQALLIGLVLVYFQAIPAEYLIFLAVYCFLSWYAHRPNIGRLRTGTERRIGDKAKA